MVEDVIHIEYLRELLLQMLELGNQIINSEASLRHSETVLSLMKTRTKIYQELMDLDLTGNVGNVENLIGSLDVNPNSKVMRELVVQLVEQNKKVLQVLARYQDWIAEQIQRNQETSMANRLYTSSSMVKQLPSGMKVDSAL